MFGAEVAPAELCARVKLPAANTCHLLPETDRHQGKPYVHVKGLVFRTDLDTAVIWEALVVGVGGCQAMPPLVEIQAEHTSQTGPGGACLGPEELLALAHKRWETGSASDDSTSGRFPSEQRPKMPPRHLGKRQRVHRVAGGPSSFMLLQLLSHLCAFEYVVPSAYNG